jgi:hypothetical protein
VRLVPKSIAAIQPIVCKNNAFLNSNPNSWDELNGTVSLPKIKQNAAFKIHH